MPWLRCRLLHLLMYLNSTATLDCHCGYLSTDSSRPIPFSSHVLSQHEHPMTELDQTAVSRRASRGSPGGQSTPSLNSVVNSSAHTATTPRPCEAAAAADTSGCPTPTVSPEPAVSESDSPVLEEKKERRRQQRRNYYRKRATQTRSQESQLTFKIGVLEQENDELQEEIQRTKDTKAELERRLSFHLPMPFWPPDSGSPPFAVLQHNYAPRQLMLTQQQFVAAPSYPSVAHSFLHTLHPLEY